MPSDFAAALEAGDREAVRRAPKADLHIHGFGGGDRDFLRERTGADIAPVDRILHSTAEMHAFADETLSSVFAGVSGRALALEATFVRARRDGVTRLEVGEDAWAITLHDGSAEALWRTLVEAHQSGGPSVEWVPQLGISRHCAIAAIERWTGPLLELGVFKTLDLSGDEGAQPIGCSRRSTAEQGRRGSASKLMSGNGARRTMYGEPWNCLNWMRSNTASPPVRPRRS